MFRYQVKSKLVLEKGRLGSFDLVLKPLYRQKERQNRLVLLLVACVEHIVESHWEVMYKTHAKPSATLTALWMNMAFVQ